MRRTYGLVIAVLLSVAAWVAVVLLVASAYR